MRIIDAQTSLPAAALQLDNTADVLALADSIHKHPAVVLQFPKWTDGRAYSQAVLLRGRLRYVGEIIATGQVLIDMLVLLRRCGFDTAQLREDQKYDAADRTLGIFDAHYPAQYQTVPPERHTGAAA